MHFKLVRPVKRKGSTNHQFLQRIPADIKALAAGLKLHVPVDGETVLVKLSPKATSIRLSLRSSDPSTVKQRQAEVAAYLETVWQSLRGQSIALTPSRPLRLPASSIARGAEEERQTEFGMDFHRDYEAMVVTPAPLEPGLEEPKPGQLEGIVVRLSEPTDGINHWALEPMHSALKIYRIDVAVEQQPNAFPYVNFV